MRRKLTDRQRMCRCRCFPQPITRAAGLALQLGLRDLAQTSAAAPSSSPLPQAPACGSVSASPPNAPSSSKSHCAQRAARRLPPTACPLPSARKLACNIPKGPLVAQRLARESARATPCGNLGTRCPAPPPSDGRAGEGIRSTRSRRRLLALGNGSRRKLARWHALARVADSFGFALCSTASRHTTAPAQQQEPLLTDDSRMTTRLPHPKSPSSSERPAEKDDAACCSAEDGIRCLFL